VAEAPIDPRQLLRVLLRRKVLLLAPWGVAVAIAAAAAFLLPPIYFSSVMLLLERGSSLGGNLRGMVGSGQSEQKAEVMREVMQSTPFLTSTISAANLLEDPVTREWALKAAHDYPGREDQKIEMFLVDHLRRAISVRRGKADVFEVTVGDNLPTRARVLADAVANQFVMSSKAAQIEAVRATQEFSAEQQRLYKEKLVDSERRLEALRRTVIQGQFTGSTLDEHLLPRARAMLEQASLDVESQRDKLTTLRQQLASQTQPGDAALLTTEESKLLVSQMSGMERQMVAAELHDAEGGSSGSVRSVLIRKVTELEAEYTRAAATQLPSLSDETRMLLVRYRVAEADLRSREARRDYLASEVGSYERRLSGAPETDLEIQRLQQEVESNRELYNSFLQQSAAAQIAEAFENAKVSGRFTVLEPAGLPLKPGKPNRPMLILLGFVLGGLIGVGSVLLVEHHDQSVKNAEEVESLLGLPVLGAVPRVEEMDRSRRRRGGPNGPPELRDRGLLHLLKTESQLGLEFRRIYLKLAKSTGRQLPKTLMVTSSTRAEGKTTTTGCLGITIARELREKMLLVDFDLRSPSLHRALGLPSSTRGVAQMLAQRDFDARIVRTTVLPNLDFLPAGKSERPASDLVDHESVEWLVTEASKRYSMVLLDCAPNLAVPDPLILGRAVEGVLFVIKAGTTIRKAAEYGVKVQREACDNIIGVLMNDSGEVLPHYYGYHDAYGYDPEVAGGESS